MGIKIVALQHPQDALFSGSMHVPDRKFTIGRSDTNDWVLTDAKRVISKRHCSIEPFQGGFRILDESTNGTSVNGKPVDRNTGQILRNGDEIELGQYRFRVEGGSSNHRSNVSGQESHDSAGPRITSILHDIAPRGVGADSAVEGEKHDVFSSGKAAEGASAIASFTKDFGWEAPPGEKVEVVKDSSAPRPSRDIVDKFEQAPVDRMLINLPKPSAAAEIEPAYQPPGKPAPILPDNWFEDDVGLPAKNAGQASAPAEFVRPEINTGKLMVIPVENVDLGQNETDPALMSINQSIEAIRAERDSSVTPKLVQSTGGSDNRTSELVSSFCAGAGISEDELAGPDLAQFFYNLGRLLTISTAELQGAHIAKRAAVSRLEMNADAVARTPWIFSIGGENKEMVVRSVIAFLAEAEPRDIEIVRGDYKDITEFTDELSSAVVGLVDRIQSGLSAQTLERHISAASRTMASLKKAALWDALLQHSGLFDTSGKSNGRADIMAMLKAELSGKKSK